MRKEGGLSVLVVSILPSEAKEQRIDQDKDSRDDPYVEAHQRVHRITMH